MKIERNYLPDPIGIEEFAERHDLTMQVVQRANGSFCASFKGSEQKGNRVLIGTSGNGETEGDAIRDYARQISGKTLVFDAGTDRRLEIDVPCLKGAPQCATSGRG